jgi:type VI secretion system protein ImpC
MRDRVEFGVDFGPAGRRREDGEPMRLLVLGDFSGRPRTEREPLAARPTHRVDIDSLAAVMRRLEPRAVLADGEIRFQQLDDFHPDRLFQRLDRFARLRQARAAPPHAPDDEEMARLLGKPPVRPAAPPAGGIDALIRDAVAPYVVKDVSAATAAHVQAVDSAMADHMRDVLHAPAFQAVEAAWRGLQWLVANLELDDTLQLHVLDVTRDELLADVADSGGDLTHSALHRVVVDRSRAATDGARWGALVGLFRFSARAADVAVLAALGLAASRSRAPFLGDADPAVTADPGEQPAEWLALRRSDVARWIALAAPRVLLRMPYGRHSDPIESFAFEELTGPPAPEDLLWAAGSLALALLIGRGFTARGWEMEPGDEREIGDLPAYTFEHDGGRQLQPCAERLLTDRDIDAFLAAGLVPLGARRDANSLVAVRFQSLADPPSPLAW